MKSNKNDSKNNKDEIRQYQKTGFFARLPFGVKATFIKYWFYGAVYFFCFMGLGLVIKSDENLLLATGLIAGAFFDVALYNIFILMADSRGEASKWWFFKSKKFYSIFINVIVLIGLFFLFHFIIVPIKKNMSKDLDWLFQEPLTAALFLTALDTALVWLKNLMIYLFKKIFKNEAKIESKKEEYIKIVDLSPVSVSIEINNKDVFLSSKPFNVFLNNEVILKKVMSNAFTIYDLQPDTQYKLSINRQNIVFTTPKIYKVYKVYENNDIQKVIDLADQYSLIIINKGTYKIKSLTLKDNIVIYLRKGAQLLASTNEDDYPIVSPLNNDKSEIYGNYKGEAMDMRRAIIHIDHIKNSKIVGEGTIDGQAQLSPNWRKDDFKVAPPHLIFINRSSNISIVGLNLKNSPQWTIHPFFSNNINLINLEIVNNKDSLLVDGINPQCSNEINIIGSRFSNLNNCIAIKSAKREIADAFHIASRNIVIKNCYMENSKSAVSLGSENSSGIHSINILQSRFVNNDFGVAIKTHRGCGKNAIIKDVVCDNIKMKDVLTPIMASMLYADDEAGDINYMINKKFVPIDENTPYLDNFVFRNIEADNYQRVAGYFYGLPEKYIYKIKIINSMFVAKEACKEGGFVDINDPNKYCKNAFIVKNVRSIDLTNVKLENTTGKRLEFENVSEINDNSR